MLVTPSFAMAFLPAGGSLFGAWRAVILGTQGALTPFRKKR
jgi:hypothetical protein